MGLLSSANKVETPANPSALEKGKWFTIVKGKVNALILVKVIILLFLAC